MYNTTNRNVKALEPELRPKKYEELNSVERTFHNVITRVCSPQVQAEIYEDLDVMEQEMLESYMREDVSKMREKAADENCEFIERDSIFGQLTGNGRNNMIRLAKHRKILIERLILDFAVSFGLINEREFNRLAIKFAGLDRKNSLVAITFVENSLKVNGKEVCTVRPTKLSKLDHILQSFEEVGWQQSSLDFIQTYLPKQISDAVTMLNRKQDAITFSSTMGAISWCIKHASDD